VKPVAQTRTVSLDISKRCKFRLCEGADFKKRTGPKRTPSLMIQWLEVWPNGDALGKRINLCSLDPQPCWSSIIGIVGDVSQFNLDAAQTTTFIFRADGRGISSSARPPIPQRSLLQPRRNSPQQSVVAGH